MNRRVCFAALSILTLGSVPAFIATGCESSLKSAETREVMSARQFKGALDQMPAKIDTVMDTIVKLQDVRLTDFSGLTRKFLNESQDIATQASRIRIEADAMNRNSADYFSAWDREVLNASGAGAKEETRAARDANANRHAMVQDYLKRGRKSFGEFSNSLNTIRETLSKGADRASITSLKGTFDAAILQGTDARNIAKALSAEIGKSQGL